VQPITYTQLVAGFSMQAKLYNITSPTAVWVSGNSKGGDGERESKWQYSQAAKKVLSLSLLGRCRDKQQNNLCEVLRTGGWGGGKRHFQANLSE